MVRVCCLFFGFSRTLSLFPLGMYEEAAIILRRLYGDDESLCLEARGTEQLASMMLEAGRADKAEGESRFFFFF